MPKRILQGVVVSDKMDKTIIVRVDRRVRHPLYKKFITRSKKFAAHDEDNLFREGDTVRIEEHRPISRRKRWTALGRVGEERASGRPGHESGRDQSRLWRQLRCAPGCSASGCWGHGRRTASGGDVIVVSVKEAIPSATCARRQIAHKAEITPRRCRSQRP